MKESGSHAIMKYCFYFTQEVNEVVQKVYGGERPVPIWLEDSEEPSNMNRILFSLVICVQRIQLTATTAGSSAVRLETGLYILYLLLHFVFEIFICLILCMKFLFCHGDKEFANYI